jgi:hypothetical protein
MPPALPLGVELLAELTAGEELLGVLLVGVGPELTVMSEVPELW